MNSIIKDFRNSHECRYCLYYRDKCKAKDACVFDFIPADSLEEDIEVFFIS